MSAKFNLLLAVEEPNSDYTSPDSANPLKAAFPELVIKPKWTIKNGHWSNSFIYKPIVYTDKDYTFKRKLNAWGFTSSLNIHIPDGKNLRLLNIKNRTFNVFGIIGNGTQGAVNDFGGFGYDAFPKDSTTLETLSYYGGYVSYSLFLKNAGQVLMYTVTFTKKNLPLLILFLSTVIILLLMPIMHLIIIFQ